MKPRAFTLVELLVSLATIAVLVAILAPALSSGKRQAMRVACQSNLRQVVQALWAYSVANDARIPYVVSPLTNGGSVPGFGNTAYADADVDPYNRDLWPDSLQNVLMPAYLGDNDRIFVCPAGARGWPRASGALRATYRDAGINQPNGLTSLPDSYFRENFGFLDGRPMKDLVVHMTGNPIQDSQLLGRTRSTYLRDMIVRNGSEIIGPHDGGINVITREFGVEFRNRRTTEEDLAAYGGGVEF